MTEAIKLPRGRHGLSRDEVVRSQRDRILLAMAEAMAEKGYVATSVADVLRRAGVSRETFYQQFSSKEDCFRAAYGRAVELIIARIVGDGLASGETGTGQTAAARPVDWSRLENLLGAYLD
ncbi:MAG: helix-turn-helix transcriptional regulator, partial [Aldersonia sp.]|nr:helix-turn-helix transcriptional regulator [Aldersonia sp.]